MGCTSSKNLEKQRLMDRWTPSPMSNTSNNYTFEYYQQEFVALTTNTYGFVKVISPKGPRLGHNKQCVSSLSDIYERFKSLETTRNVPHHDSRDMLYSQPQCTKHCVVRDNTMNGRGINTRDYVTSEMINVREMMHGLEEAPTQQNHGAQKLKLKSSLANMHVEKDHFANENSIPIHRDANMFGPHSESRSVNKRGPLQSLPLSPFSQEMGNNNDNTRSKLEYDTRSGSKLRMAWSTNDDLRKVSTNPPQINEKKYVTPLFIPSNTMSSRERSMDRRNMASPDPISPLFDPILVSSYEKKLEEQSKENWNKHNGFGLYPTTITRDKPFGVSTSNPLYPNVHDPFECFPKKCPPHGEDKLVIYTTSLRGIKKTFEDCNVIRAIFQSFGLRIDERDVSMHLGFLNELRELMGRMVAVPRVFIKGRYVGGIEDVTKLHEDGKLGELLIDLPKMVDKGKCEGCDGIRFVPCLTCRGSRKVRDERNNVGRCSYCNENGLIKCPICT